MEFCDLHIHTNFSDSDMTSEEVLTQSRKKGLACIAITDHDEVGALKQIHSKNIPSNLELIAGVELSAEYRGREVHILGYFIDLFHKELTEKLDYIKKMRRRRIILMAKKFKDLGVTVDIEEIFSQFKEAVLTRLHFARYLVNKKIVSSIKEAFDKYLNYNKPAYVSKFNFSAKEAISLINKAGGLSFIAHPHQLGDISWIKIFKNYGLAGIEVIYPNYQPQQIYFYSGLADELSLLKSGGSDAHGSFKSFTSIGAVEVPYSFVEEMKSALKKR